MKFSDPLDVSRRYFLGQIGTGIGAAALSALMNPKLIGAEPKASKGAGELGAPHFFGKAKRVIFLFQSGAPSQMDLFDYKPRLRELHGEELFRNQIGPNKWSDKGYIKREQRLTGMTANQASFPIAGSKFNFKQHGQSGQWFSELLPHTASVADDICVIKTMKTEAINHAPAITFFQTGSQQPGRPSFGSWISYGLGTDNENMPGYIVLLSEGSARRDSQALYSRLWGSGFLPSEHQGVQFRRGADPVLYLSDPDGLSRSHRRLMLDAVRDLNQSEYEQFGDPEIRTRIAQYEMAYRMQTSVPEVTDLSSEPDYIFDMYGEESRKPGTYAANCLLARRLAERGVKFIQLFHRGWDQHGDMAGDLPRQCGDTDQPSAALVKDLKQRGMLDDTLVIWGGEFGRTTYCQGALSRTQYGRDHHPRCFSYWIAGGGVKGGHTYGETDEFGYDPAPGQHPVHVHDFHATALQLMGIDHERLTYFHQGRRFRLTDIAGRIVEDVIA